MSERRHGLSALPTWVTGYRRAWLRGDLIAGLTVWAVLIPESLAYATIAGVPPVLGLYAAIPALILYALLGSSRHMVVGPMSATAALSATIVASHVGSDSMLFITITVALALLTGVLGLVAGLARLGFLASFISTPVLKGFIIGLALTIIVGQVPALVGIEKAEGAFFEKAWEALRDLGDVHWPTAVIGFAAIALILALRRWLSFLPAALVVAVLGIASVWAFSLDDYGVDIVGAIPGGLASIALPAADIDDYYALVLPAAGLLLIGFVEGLAAGKSYAIRGGYRVDPNRELSALGAANVGAGLFGGMVVNGSLSKTAVNSAAGARSQFSNVVVAALTVVTLLFLTGLFEKLPEAVLAAIVITALAELVNFEVLKRLYRVWSAPLGRIYRVAARVDFIAALVALVGVLVFDTLRGLAIGVAVSVGLVIYRASRPYVADLAPLHERPDVWVDRQRHRELAAPTGVIVLRVEGGIFFANAENVRDRIAGAAGDGVHGVVIDASSVPTIDVTGAEMLAELTHDLARRGVTLVLAHAAGQVRDVVDASGADAVGTIFQTVGDAVQHIGPTPSEQN